MNKNFNSLVSIIIPVYNGSNYMREAIDSAIAQTYKNIEIVVVNDGSTDNTEEIAKSYGDKIRYYKKENGGVATALNLAIKKSKGEYISWLSHDDIYYIDKIEKQIKFLSELEDENVILYSDYVFIDENSQQIREMILDHDMLSIKPEYALLRSAINGCTLLISKRAFEEHGLFDENLKFTQDYAKWFEMKDSFQFVHMPQLLVKYRLHDLQDTKKSHFTVDEGNVFWKRIIKSISVEDKIRLEGTEYRFYREMKNYLIYTPYSRAAIYANDMAVNCAHQLQSGNSTIAFVSHSSGKYGAERAMLEMIDILVGKNYFVHVVLPGDGPLEKELIKRDIPYDKISMQWWANTKKSAVKVMNEANNNALNLAYILNQINPDVVFTSTSVIAEGAIAAKILNIPHIWNIVEFGRKEHGINYSLSEKERMSFIDDHSDRIFFASSAIKDYYDDKIQINQKSSIIPPILELSALTTYTSNTDSTCNFFEDGFFKLAIVGNISQGKGQKDAILAVKNLVKKGYAVQLVVAGGVVQKQYYEELQDIVQQNNMQNNIKFVSYVEDVSQLFSQASVILMCSIFEGFGRVTVEAMMHKKPVIGARSGATTELIKDECNGLLYKSGNYTELANKIEYFINNKDKLTIYGECGYNFVKEKFGNNESVEVLMREINQLENDNKSDHSAIMLELMHQSAQRRDAEILKYEKELSLLKSSKFLKMRNVYMKFKNLF